MPAEPRFDRGRLAEVVDLAPDGVVVVDTAGRITYWNAGATRIFGYSESEALGASLDLIIPERLQERHWTAFSHAVATGTSRYGADDLLAVPARTSDGRTISIEFTVVLLRRDDAVDHVAAVIREVTERRARETELRRRVAELEEAGTERR